MYPQSFIESKELFVRFGFEHNMWLLFGAVILTAMIYYGRKASEKNQQKIGLAHALATTGVWALLNVVIYQYNGLMWSALLPFHVCYFFNLVLPFLHSKRSYQIFEIAYFWVLAGCIQGLVTPDLEETFPHYFNIRYFVVHLGLVMSVLYATVIYRFRPTWKGILRAMLVGNIYMFFAHIVNLCLGTNFMYVEKAPPATILDLFGEHYLFWAEFAATFLFCILMLPFVNWKNVGNFIKNREFLNQKS
jgi:hypothetical integral membrane protein (TIGR02206 family)